MEPVEAARALVEERFPECLAAFVGGSVIAGRGTPTSDLDIVVITTREEAPYRESLMFGGWPVELFVHTIESYKWYFASDAKQRTPTLARMCLDSVILVNRDGVADAVRQEARQLIEGGPAPLTGPELEFRRYMLTDLLDDFTGSARPEETVFIAASLLESSIDLVLAVNRRWSGKGKWVARALDAFDPALTHEAVDAIRALHHSQSRDALARFATRALDAAGGRLFEGFRQGGRKSAQG